MTTPKPLLSILQGKAVDRPAIWLMRQAGRYLPEYRKIRAEAGGFLNLALTPDWAAEVTLQPVRRFGMDGAILFSDILMVPFGLGQELRFGEGEGPKLPPLESAKDFSQLQQEGLINRLAPVFETVRKVKAELPLAVTLLGFAGAPWTVASYMIEGGGSRDFLKIKQWAYRYPDSLQILIDLLVEATTDYLSAQIDAGADAIQIFDSWIGALPPHFMERWGIIPVTAIIARLKARHPHTPVIVFPRGAGLVLEAYARHPLISALSLDSGVPLDWAAKELQPHAILQGNLDPAILLTGGEILKNEARRILHHWEHSPFIFNLGHGVIKETPPEHVAELVSYIQTAGLNTL